MNYIWLKRDTYVKEVAQHSMFILVHVIKACITCGLTCEYCMICQSRDCYYFDQCIKCRHFWRTIQIALRCVALRCVALRCVALRCVALRCVALRCVALRCVALRCVALRCVALRCVALRCVALRCVALRNTC